jgi:hypothetical protein
VRNDIFALFKCSFLKIALGAIRPAPISLYLGVIAFAGADPALSSSSHTLKALIAASASARLIIGRILGADDLYVGRNDGRRKLRDNAAPLRCGVLFYIKCLGGKRGTD